MDDKPASALPHLARLLPYYVSGTIWLLDATLLVSLNTTYDDARDAAKSWASLIAPFKFPDIAVGFMLIIAGVLLPFALARAFNPVADMVLNLVARLQYRDDSPIFLTTEHVDAVASRIRARFHTPPPLGNWGDVLMAYLLHIKSAAVERLATEYASVDEQGHLAFPVAIFVGIAVFATSERGAIGGVAALAAFVIAAAVLVYRANQRVRAWEERVMLTFLVVSETPIDSGAQPPLRTE
jgi:hypothetical protein